MAYEIEKRSKLTKKKYAALQTYLDIHAKFVSEKRLDSYLFRKPSYLRIRLVSDDPLVYITEKTGTYHDVARFEKDFTFPRTKLPRFITTYYTKGYTRCVPVITYRRTYKLDGLKVELNRINYLGLILEVEAVTKKKSAIATLEKKVNAMLLQLDVKELPADVYQRMLDRNHREHAINLKTVSFEK